VRAAVDARRIGEENRMPDASGQPSGKNPGPSIVLTSALIIALVVMNILVLSTNDPTRKLGPHYYVATGDSISFGYQPNLSFFSGFADDLEASLKQGELNNPKTKVQITLANYACAGETTTTMIEGGCEFRNFIKEPYACPQICSQLDAVVAFLNEHKGFVSPVTFELGADDVLPDFNSGACIVSNQDQADADLKRMDDNLTKLDKSNPNDPTDPNNGILPRLVNALRVGPPLPVPGPGQGQVRLSGDLVMLNYYNPFAKACPGSVEFIHTLNDHLAQDAALFHIPVVDVYTAFDTYNNRAGMAANVCTLTWFCDRGDIHPTTTGYQVIAAAVQALLGYPNPLPVPAAQSDHRLPVAADRRQIAVRSRESHAPEDAESHRNQPTGSARERPRE
jgi:lysophospholipase L1-like esterase